MARSIRQNIILSFTIFSLISVIAVGTISIVVIGIIGQTTTEESTNALKVQIQRNIEKSAQQNAKVIEKKLSNAENMVEMMASELESMFDTDNTYPSRTAYYDYYFQNDRTPGFVPDDTHASGIYRTDEGDPLHLSWSYSSYYIPGSTLANYNTDPAYTSLNDTIGTVSNMDHVFSYVHDQAPEFRWLYITFVSNGLFINYPGSTVAGGINDRISEPFDWRDSVEYDEVLVAGGTVVFTAPYFDPIDRTLLITIGKAVKVGNGPIFALVFGDLLIETIKEKILDVEIFNRTDKQDTGYATLIKRDGTVVAHPEYTPPTPIPDNYELPTIETVEVNTDDSSALSVADIIKITSGNNGSIEYTRKGEKRYLAYQPVEKGDYICLIVVPERVAIAAVGPLQDRIALTTLATITQVLIIIVVTGIVSVLAAVFTANRIIRPITRLTGIASKMATSERLREDLLGDIELDIDPELEKQQDEVGDLTRAFKGMMTALKEDVSKKPEKKSFWD
ncbi:MAG: HAMP domain-containing protein [Candidatus Hodarchaeales archaeon]|jgi:HAMP domain-containing protein